MSARPDYSYRTLIGHGVWMVGEAVYHGTNLSPAILHLFYLSWPTLSRDKEFVDAWREMHNGSERVDARARINRHTRLREFALIVDALYRNNVISAGVTKEFDTAAFMERVMRDE